MSYLVIILPEIHLKILVRVYRNTYRHTYRHIEKHRHTYRHIQYTQFLFNQPSFLELLRTRTVPKREALATIL